MYDVHWEKMGGVNGNLLQGMCGQWHVSNVRIRAVGDRCAKDLHSIETTHPKTPIPLPRAFHAAWNMQQVCVQADRARGVHGFI